jgi:hypothetical protein
MHEKKKKKELELNLYFLFHFLLLQARRSDKQGSRQVSMLPSCQRTTLPTFEEDRARTTRWTTGPAGVAWSVINLCRSVPKTNATYEQKSRERRDSRSAAQKSSCRCPSRGKAAKRKCGETDRREAGYTRPKAFGIKFTARPRAPKERERGRDKSNANPSTAENKSVQHRAGVWGLAGLGK